MADLYQLTFVWPHTEPNDVVITGTFDGWNSTVHLKRTSTGFEGSVPVPYGSKVLYKFRVDGNWITHENQPTEVDPIGNVNNVTYTPEKPVNLDSPSAEKTGLIVVDTDATVPASAPIPVIEGPPSSKAPEVAEPRPVPTPSEPEAVKEETVPPPAPKAEFAPVVPVEIQPVLDATTNSTVESKQEPAAENSTHAPASAPVPVPVPEPALVEAAPTPATPAVPELKVAEVPAQPAKATSPPPIKTDAQANGSHAKESTGTSTPPTSASVPSTPKSKLAFPSAGHEDSPDRGSLRSRTGSERKKRVSIFQKIKDVFHHHHDHSPERGEKKEKKGRHSLSLSHSRND